ncbi:hypothetical protein D7X87_25055 [bacterium D16-54]|nr:hypothetical protein D7X87_25055 [bacterium D16-54]RKJ14179.1 hypothetical protein D7X65_13170 [bacterium D16-56]
MQNDVLVLRTENLCVNISVYFPECTSPECSAQPATPPFLNLHTRKISSKIYTGTLSTEY